MLYLMVQKTVYRNYRLSLVCFCKFAYFCIAAVGCIIWNKRWLRCHISFTWLLVVLFFFFPKIAYKRFMDRRNCKKKILFQLSSSVNVDCLHLLCCMILRRMADHWEDQETATVPNRNSRSVIEGPSETISPWCNYLLLLDKCQSAFKSLSKQNVKKKLRCLFSKLETLPQESNPLNDPVLPGCIKWQM